ncbi:hypothetical protein BD324DRAFT_113749 [Kockovaella imperatae]|uniref:Uncharacterized protein n=1 Tax=Kockovaella imperatae TaxID=4999 RepID=A0A1Y1UC13_9TREE|nr:hypothetical protein BD324DRAFT_113749 [Kockovaella imperatae]ORX35026.1 hypothetical protein BD324DRAFT_113749 [Kockovaella imperatae]
MEASSSFYIPPRPHPTPLQRRRAVRSSGQESDEAEEEAGPGVYGMSPVRSSGPVFATEITGSPLESFGPMSPTDRKHGLKRAATAKLLESPGSPPMRPTVAATLSGLKIRTVSPPTKPITCPPTLQKKKHSHRDRDEVDQSVDLDEHGQRAQSPQVSIGLAQSRHSHTLPQQRKVSRSKSTAEIAQHEPRDNSIETPQISRSKSIAQAFDPDPRDRSAEPRQVSRSKSIVQMFDPDPRADSAPAPRQVSRSKSIAQMFEADERPTASEAKASVAMHTTADPNLQNGHVSRSKSRSRAAQPEDDVPKHEIRKVSRSKTYAAPEMIERRNTPPEHRKLSRTNSRLSRNGSRLSRHNSRLSRSSSHARRRHHAEYAEPRRVSRSKSEVPHRKPSIRRAATEPIEHVSQMPMLPPLTSAILPSHPQLPRSQVYQQRRQVMSPEEPLRRRETSHQNHVRYATSHLADASELDSEDSLSQFIESPEPMTSSQLSHSQSHTERRRSSGHRQPAHPMLSQEKPEQITILKGSQSAYPPLRKNTRGSVLILPPVPRESQGGRRSNAGTPEPRRMPSGHLRSSASQTLPNGYTFPTSISQSIPRGPMRPLCAVPTLGYTSEAITPLLRYEADQDDGAPQEEPLPLPQTSRNRNIASPASGISMNATSSEGHGIIMINGRPFSPDARPFSPDMITSESSLPATPEASDMGHGHLLQVYGDEKTPTLEQLINEQITIPLRPVELDDAGSAYVVDLSKAARKAARRAERLAEKEAKKEAKAVRRATKKGKGSMSFNIGTINRSESPLDVNESEMRRAAELAAQYEAEQVRSEARKTVPNSTAKETIQGGAQMARTDEPTSRTKEPKIMAVEENVTSQADGQAALEAEQKEIRRAAFRAEKREEERAERAAFEKRRAEERVEREAKEAAVKDAAELAAIAAEEDAKARIRIARRSTTRTVATPETVRTHSESPRTPQRTEDAASPDEPLSPQKSTRRIQPRHAMSDSVVPKTPAQLEKEAYETARAQAEIDAVAMEAQRLKAEIQDKVRVTSHLEHMANTLAAARRARRESKILDYGYPSAELDPPHRTEGVGLKLISPGGPSSSASTRPRSKSKSKVVAMVAAVVPGLPKTDTYPRGFRSISYADLRDAAEERQIQNEERGWEADTQMKTLEKEQSRSKDFKDWLRKKKSNEVARRLSGGAEDDETQSRGTVPRRQSDDPRLSLAARNRRYERGDYVDEGEWETDDEGSDRSLNQDQLHNRHHHHSRHSTHLSDAEVSEDQWEDLSNASRSLSDQEVNFRTSDLDEPGRRRSKSKSSPKILRPQPLKRASTVKLLKLERSEASVHFLPEPKPLDPDGLRSTRNPSRPPSVGSGPWLW